MRPSTPIKTVSYFKANAAPVLDDLDRRRQPIVIIQNGQAKAVLQDLASYEETQEALALLKILALGERQVRQGKVKPIDAAVKRLRDRAAT